MLADRLRTRQVSRGLGSPPQPMMGKLHLARSFISYRESKKTAGLEPLTPVSKTLTAILLAAVPAVRLYDQLQDRMVLT